MTVFPWTQVSTKDGVLVLRHDPTLDDSTGMLTNPTPLRRYNYLKIPNLFPLLGCIGKIAASGYFEGMPVLKCILPADIANYPQFASRNKTVLLPFDGGNTTGINQLPDTSR